MLTTVRTKLNDELKNQGITENQAFVALSMVIDSFESGSISKFEAKTRIMEIRDNYKRNRTKHVFLFCQDLLKHF